MVFDDKVCDRIELKIVRTTNKMVQCLPHTVHTILWWRVGVRFHLNHQKRVKLSVRCCQRVIKQAFTVLCYGNLWSLVVSVVRLWRKEKKKEKRVVFFTACAVKRLHPERLALVLFFPAESIEMTIINAAYSNINFKLSLSVLLPFLWCSLGEISERGRRLCIKFYARILHK